MDGTLSKEFLDRSNNKWNSLKKESIQNEFRTCGIYPWNQHTFDKSKCLGQKLKDIPDTAILTYRDFNRIVERDIAAEEKLELLKSFFKFPAKDQALP